MFSKEDMRPPDHQFYNLPKELVYATVKKTRSNGRIEDVRLTLVLGLIFFLNQFLKRSKVSKNINTSFVERNNGTDRHQNSRKKRKTYSFSKNRDVHDGLGYFITYSYNFIWTVRTLRILGEDDKYIERTPAMAAGLTDHVWTMQEWITLPVVATFS